MRFRIIAGDGKALLGEGVWHGRLGRVYAHWQSLVEDDALPAYDRLQLSALAPDLRFLATLRVEGADFRFTSVGEEIAERYGRNLPGSFLADQFVGPAQLDVLAAHRACAEERLPVISEVTLNEVDLSIRVPYQRLLLPFAGDNGPVDHILWAMAFPG
ncbi:MAG: PAS domain-containing protein [Alphaproteobacteria bacterium]